MAGAAVAADSFAATCWLERADALDDNRVQGPPGSGPQHLDNCRHGHYSRHHQHQSKLHHRQRASSVLLLERSRVAIKGSNRQHRTVKMANLVKSLAIALTLTLALSQQLLHQNRLVQATTIQTLATPLSLSLSLSLSSSSSSLSSIPPTMTTSAAIQADQFIQQAFPHNSLSPNGAAFDASQFKSVYEAIKAHPDLQEFANLCEAKGVKEIAAMDKTALTIFAPIDKSLADLLAKSKLRSINLAELAKHHIAQGLVMPDDNTKYPHQFQSYALLSPLYLNQIHLPAGKHSARQQQQQQQLFVNNAKILATYLIQIDSDNQYQTLHVIDQPLDFAYVNRRTQLRGQQAQAASPLALSAQGPTGGMSPLSSSMSTGASHRFATVKKSINLDDLLEQRTNGELAELTSGAVYEFYERFGDLLAGQPQVDLYHARALRNQANTNQWQRFSAIGARDQALAYDQTKLAKLFQVDQQHQLRGKLYHLNESNSLNTYFLPISSEELDQLLAARPNNGDDASILASRLNSLLALQAHIIPDQVLFTRTMPLGQLHSTLFNQHAHADQSVQLSLVKTLPAAAGDASFALTSGDNLTHEHEVAVSRKLLSTPLIVQAKCAPDVRQPGGQRAPAPFKHGITNAEILVANIPISNGVLHLIKRPLLAQSNSLLDYINDNEHQLTNIVHALGSQSGSQTAYSQLMDGNNQATTNKNRDELNRFREILARGDRQLLSFFSNEFLHSNRTILAPTDEAFSRLRYDLRALISGDELLIPSHWDPSYRQDLLERLLKRHIIPDQTLTSGTIGSSSSQSAGVNLNGQLVSLKRSEVSNEADSEVDDESNLRVECDATSANLIHHDLIGTNGVLHLIDRVLGEDQETVHSLLESIVMRHSAKYAAASGQTDQSPSGASLASPIGELSQLIEASLRSQALDQQQQSLDQQQAATIEPGQQVDNFQAQSVAAAASKRQGPELQVISKTIDSYLGELSAAKRQLLASSVNISYSLAKLISRAESRDDWNEKFKLQDKSFTYFIPNDLAWFRLQQAQPELYRPLMFFLEQQSNANGNTNNEISGSQSTPDGQSLELTPAPAAASAGEPQATISSNRPRASESSHRLLQILERHLIGSKKLAPKELDQLASVQTIGATLRLVDQQQLQQPYHLAQSNQQLSASADGHGQPMGAFAALHSIIGGGGGSGSSSGQASSTALQSSDYQQAISAANQIKRALKFSSAQANIVQAHETSNGFVYLIDNVLISPDDSEYIVQTSSTPAISSTMSSLLGAHNSAILDFFHNFLSTSTRALNANLMLSLIVTLTCAIIVLALVALGLTVRRRRQSKLNRHEQLESGLTSSSSANSGSTSTTKSL